MSDNASPESQPTSAPATEGATPDPKAESPLAPSAEVASAAPATGSPPAAPASPPEDDRIRRGFAALSRKEKALREKERLIKTAEETTKRLEALQGKAMANPIEFLKEFGLSYEQLTDYILGTEKPAPTPEDRVKALEERLEKEAREAKDARERAASEATERSIANYKEQILKPGIKGNADKYELINARGDEGSELVFEVIEQYHAQNGKVLAWHEAADHVEKALEDEARKLLSLKKFQISAKAPASERQPEGDGGNTLSRSRGGELPVISDDSLPLDPDERNRALAQRYRLWG